MKTNKKNINEIVKLTSKLNNIWESSKAKRIIAKSLYPFTMTFFVLFATIEPAHANLLDNLAQAGLDILNNNFLRLVAIGAVIITGIGGLRGQIAWANAIIVMLAIVIIFGAAGIVDFVRDNASVV